MVCRLQWYLTITVQFFEFVSVIGSMFNSLQVTFTMDVSDRSLVCNRDWDPAYLSEIFVTDFEEFPDLWDSNITDMDLVSHVEKVERYCPIVEDISVDDDRLCQAVEAIEKE